ncbi:Universal stress protein PHOS34 [Cardamine amara subsp. amara]|uniref:Universal stress protein PHOS34 n=1 Tax=Cardamine amara subsp. amara TaxID=228776 RepID=A0ABD1CA44_CARAN
MAESGGRRIGVAVDFSECSKKALSWAIDNLVRDGDHLILITIAHDMHYEEGEMQLWETVGSPLIPLSEFSDAAVMKKYAVKPDAETLDIVNTASRKKSITVVMKIYWGDPREKICAAAEQIPLSSLVMGNRGLGGLKRMIMGSVSNHVVNNVTCPVTVVKAHT